MNAYSKSSIVNFVLISTLFACALVYYVPAQADPVSKGSVLPKHGIESDSAPFQRKVKTLASLRAALGKREQFAALRALHIALSEVGDGSTFAWGRPKYQLRGMITPTVSFRDASGNICRHVIYSLSLGRYLKRIEGIACRMKDKRWTFES